MKHYKNKPEAFNHQENLANTLLHFQYCIDIGKVLAKEKTLPSSQPSSPVDIF